MKSNNPAVLSRRNFNKRLIVTGISLGLSLALRSHSVFAQTSPPMKIGIIGSGRMGGAVGTRWAEAGHKVLFSSRNPDQLDELLQQAGENASAGYPADAIAFAEVILIAVPYGALPQIGQDYAGLMRGKVVIDCGNPRADRDGPMADDAINRGTGITSAEYLPGVRLVRALNAVSFVEVRDQAHRPGALIGVPIAGDDAAAVAIAAGLVTDCGFDPVIVGGLARAREFDRGTAVYVKGLTAAELREALNL
jgi:8-hydroxy-5-deazaflavin:NADPH oxidoreductase